MSKFATIEDPLFFNGVRANFIVIPSSLEGRGNRCDCDYEVLLTITSWAKMGSEIAEDFGYEIWGFVTVSPRIKMFLHHHPFLGNFLLSISVIICFTSPPFTVIQRMVTSWSAGIPEVFVKSGLHRLPDPLEWILIKISRHYSTVVFSRNLGRTWVCWFLARNEAFQKGVYCWTKREANTSLHSSLGYGWRGHLPSRKGAVLEALPNLLCKNYL